MSSSSDRVSPPPLKRPRLQSSVEEKQLSSSTHTSAAPSATNTRSQVKDCKIRIYSWNVNGISSLLPPESPAISSFFRSTQTRSPAEPQTTKVSSSPLRDCLRKWKWPDIVGLQEVKISHSDQKMQASVRRAAHPQPQNPDDIDDKSDNDDGPEYEVHFCLPTDKYNAIVHAGKVHGVCLLISQRLITNITANNTDVPAAVDNITSNTIPITSETGYSVRTVDWDLEGRVLILEVPASKLAIFNIYAVNGTSFPYRDSSSGEKIGTRHDRKRDFHLLLADQVRQYEEGNGGINGDGDGDGSGAGWGVVLAGDMNISRSAIDSFPQLREGSNHARNRAHFHEHFMVKRGMVDTFRFLHGEEARKYTYRPTSKPWGDGGDRVDMILVSKILEGDVVEADILDTKIDRGPSDHVPLFLELQTWREDARNGK